MNLPSLKTALRGNALFSVLCGLDMLLFTDQIIAILGDIPAIFLQGLGIMLLLFAANVFWVSTGKPISSKFTKMIIAMDWAWVASTPIVLFFAWSLLTPIGVEITIAIAAVVGIFASLQSRGLKQSETLAEAQLQNA